MLIGYVQVSMPDQNLDPQIDALHQAGCEKVFVDQIQELGQSSRLGELIESLREGDTLVVWRLDRLGISLKHLLKLMTFLEEKKIGFKSLTESIDTTTLGGGVVFQILPPLAESERNRIRERTLAGLAAARARGRFGGRPPALSEKEQEVAVLLYKEGKHSVQDLCHMMGISKPTLYSYLRKAKSPLRTK